MAVVLQSAVHIFGLFLLKSIDAVIDGSLSFDVDKVSRFLLPNSYYSTKSLLLGRFVPPRIDYNNSVGSGEV